jgi:hypothetical protein
MPPRHTPLGDGRKVELGRAIRAKSVTGAVRESVWKPGWLSVRPQKTLFRSRAGTSVFGMHSERGFQAKTGWNWRLACWQRRGSDPVAPAWQRRSIPLLLRFPPRFPYRSPTITSRYHLRYAWLVGPSRLAGRSHWRTGGLRGPGGTKLLAGGVRCRQEGNPLRPRLLGDR